jgi:hypothetical protein
MDDEMASLEIIENIGGGAVKVIQPQHFPNYSLATNVLFLLPINGVLAAIDTSTNTVVVYDFHPSQALAPGVEESIGKFYSTAMPHRSLGRIIRSSPFIGEKPGDGHVFLFIVSLCIGLGLPLPCPSKIDTTIWHEILQLRSSSTAEASAVSGSPSMAWPTSLNRQASGIKLDELKEVATSITVFLESTRREIENEMTSNAAFRTAALCARELIGRAKGIVTDTLAVGETTSPRAVGFAHLSRIEELCQSKLREADAALQRVASQKQTLDDIEGILRR